VAHPDLFLKPVAVSAPAFVVRVTVTIRPRLGPLRLALYSLTESARTPFHAEPTQFAWIGSRALAGMNSTAGTVTAGSASDPMVLFGAPVLLGCLALVACYLRARQAARIDPIVALRGE
jgi:hypothetical protein